MTENIITSKIIKKITTRYFSQMNQLILGIKNGSNIVKKDLDKVINKLTIALFLWKQLITVMSYEKLKQIICYAETFFEVKIVNEFSSIHLLSPELLKIFSYTLILICEQSLSNSKIFIKQTNKNQCEISSNMLAYDFTEKISNDIFFTLINDFAKNHNLVIKFIKYGFLLTISDSYCQFQEVIEVLY